MQVICSSSSVERPHSELTPESGRKQQEEVGGAVGVASKRRVSFAPILATGVSVSPESAVPSPLSQSSPVSRLVSEEDQQQQALKKEERQEEAIMSAKSLAGEDVMHQQSGEAGGSSCDEMQSSPASSVNLVGSVGSDPHYSPGSEVSEEGSTASSLSSSTSLYEYPLQSTAVKGRGGKRGRLRGRGKRAGRARGASPTVPGVSSEEVTEECLTRGRGGRGRKRRGRETR